MRCPLGQCLGQDSPADGKERGQGMAARLPPLSTVDMGNSWTLVDREAPGGIVKKKVWAGH